MIVWSGATFIIRWSCFIFVWIDIFKQLFVPTLNLPCHWSHIICAVRSVGKLAEMSLVRIGRQGKLILKWKYFARILLSLQAITMGKWEEIEYLPTEHFDILPYNMSLPAGVPLLLPQSPWFSNGAKGFRSVNLKIFLRCDENASSPIYSPLFLRDITSLFSPQMGAAPFWL